MSRKNVLFIIVLLGVFLIAFFAVIPVQAEETAPAEEAPAEATPAEAAPKETAQGDGEIAFEEGLAAFEEGNWPVALTKFSETLKAEPDHAPAHQYRGVTLLKLKQPGEAVKELEKAKALDPKAQDVNLDLGQAYQEIGKLDEAEKAYRDEIKNYPKNAQAHFSLGYALFMKKMYPECLEHFAEARKLAPDLAAAAKFYEGAALFKTDKKTEAQSTFEAVLKMNPSPEIAAGAKKYLEAIKGKGEKPRKKRGLVASLLYQYDTNVIAASEETQFPVILEDEEISDKEDYRGVFTISGFYRYMELKPWEFEVRYAFYQNQHFEIDMFNLQNHSPAMTISRTQKISDKKTLVALDYRFGEALLGNDLTWYSVNHYVTPMFRLYWTNKLYTAIGYRFNIEDFNESQPNRDNMAHTGFIKTNWIFWNKRASLTATTGLDYEDAEDIAYDVYRPWITVALGAKLPYKIKTKLTLKYEYEDHFDDDEQNREDDVYSAEFLVFRPIWRKLEANLGVSHKENQSNVDSLTYDRTVVGGGVIFRY